MHEEPSSEHERYEVTRTQQDKETHVISREGRFYEDVPTEIRRQGPWWGTARGRIADLKLPYRAALARDGYVVVIESMITFRAELEKQ